MKPLLTALLSVVLASSTVTVAQAAAPQQKTQAPGYYRLMLGDFEVTALSDGTVELPVDKLLAAPAAATNATLQHSFLRSPLETSVNGYLINTGTKLVLIDTGAGVMFGPTLGRLLSNLKAAGYTPEQVDEIYITHFHGDHMGGLLEKGLASYPNAVVRMARAEADYYLSKAKMAAAPEAARGAFAGAMKATQPYADSGRIKPIDGDAELVPGIRSVLTSGHTPGHTIYQVESKGQRLIVWGDLMHVAAVQFPDPTVTISFDTDSKVMLPQRLKIFAEAAASGALVAGAHLSFPGLGHLRAEGKGYQFVPVNYASRP
ncbi:MAG TPA: MBL fold metallo-hydrolase [Burkholderiaceae bacterium]